MRKHGTCRLAAAAPLPLTAPRGSSGGTAVERRRSGIHAGTWVVVAAALWLVRFVTLNGMPWQGAPLWMGWFDQSRYFTSATALAHGDLTPAQHWYPLAYPLLAAPFAWIVPGDPFLPLDLLLYLATGWAFRRVAGRLGIGAWTATACFVLTTLVDAKVARAWVDPWTTTLSAALIWMFADRVLHMMDAAEPKRRRDAVAFGLLAAAIPLVRPVDALISAFGLAVLAVVLLRRRALSPRIALLVCASGTAVVAGYAALHLAIYGPHATPYMIAAARTGFIWSDIGWKAYVLLIHAEPWFPDTQAILERMPWLPLGLAGLIGVGVAGDAAQRRVAGLLVLLAIPVSAVMLTYADLQPPGLWRFGNIHYFKWTLPLFALGVMLAVRLAREPGRWAMLAVMTAACFAPLLLRIVPSPVDDGTPARMLVFRGDTARAWDEAYFAPVAIRDSAGAMTHINDFHQVPDATGQRAIAVSRLFGAQPRRSDPGETLVPQPQAPDGRFAERVTVVGF